MLFSVKVSSCHLFRHLRLLSGLVTYLAFRYVVPPNLRQAKGHMPRQTKFFSWDSQEKQCNGCEEVKGLANFREANNATTDKMKASFYSYLCRGCENDRAKEYQKRKKK